MITGTTNDRCFELRGLSTDTKPTKWPDANGVAIGNGSIFFEIDTSDVYMFNEVAKLWVKLS